MDSQDPDLRVLAEHLVRALSNPIEETPPLDEIGVSWLKKSGGKKGVAHPGASGAKASPTTEKSTVAPVTSLALSSDNKQIAVGNQDGLLRIMDRSGKRTVAKFSDHRSQINALAFSVNGQMVYSAGMDCLVCAFQWVQQESPWHHYAHNHSTTCLAVDRMGEYLLSGGGDGTIVLRTLETLKDSEPLRAHRGRVSACAFLGNLVVTSGLDDGKVATWQTKGLTPLAKADFHGDCIIDMDANAYVKLIALSVSSRRIGFFEPNTLKRSPLKIDTLVTVHSLRFSPKGTYLAGGCADGSVRVWHTQSGKLVGYQMVHAKKPILAVIWLAGGSGLLVGTNDGQVKKYSLGWLRFCAFFRPKESEQPGTRH